MGLFGPSKQERQQEQERRKQLHNHNVRWNKKELKKAKTTLARREAEARNSTDPAADRYLIREAKSNVEILKANVRDLGGEW